MKARILLFGLMACAHLLGAAPLSGTYTVGGSSPDYASLSAAVADLMAEGVGGAVDFHIRTGTYNEQLSIGSYAGMESYGVRFVAESGVSGDVIISHAASGNPDNYVLFINGTANLSFEHLSLHNAGSDYSRVVYATNGPENLAFRHCQFTGSQQNDGQYDRYLFVIENNAMHGLELSGNGFSGGSIALYLVGTPSENSTGVQIRDNTVSGAYAYGFRIGNYLDGPLISGNHITAPSPASANYYGIHASNLLNASQIVGNQILASPHIGLYVRCTGTSGQKALIANNMVQSQGSAGTPTVELNSCLHTNFYYNSIRQDNSNLGAWALRQTNGGSYLALANNIVANLGGGMALRWETASALISSDHNNFYSSGSTLGIFGSTAQSDLAAWATATGKDGNSLSVNPLFVSASDLHSGAAQLDAAGTPLASVVDDIDGEARDAATPDIGADEFSSLGLADDVGVAGIAPALGCALGASEPIRVSIQNYGGSPITGIDVAYQIDGGTVFWENTGSLSIAAGESALFTFSQLADLSALGDYAIVAYTAMPGDADSANDTLAISLTNHPLPILSLTADTAVCSGQPVLLEASGGQYYEWADGASGPSRMLTPTSSQGYVLTMTDANTCSVIGSVHVAVWPTPAAPSLDLGDGDAVLCAGETLSLSTDAPQHIEWSTGAGAASIVVAEAGTYSVRYWDADSLCVSPSSSVSVSLSVGSLGASASGAVCAGTAVDLELENAAVALWSNGSMASSISVSPTATDTFTVGYITPEGCGYADTAIVAVLPHAVPDAVGGRLPEGATLNVPISGNTFSWAPAAGATLYDVYVWPQSAVRPNNPTGPNLSAISYNPGVLSAGTAYFWQIRAKNPCFSTFSDTLAFTTASQPDLSVSIGSVPSTALSNTSISLTWTVSNGGAASTGATAWNDYIWLSSDEDLRNADDRLLATVPNQSYLLPGESYTQSSSVSLPEGLSGVFLIFVTSDNYDAYCIGGCGSGLRGTHGQSLAESNEQNNFALDTLIIVPAPAPDLQVSAVGAPTAAFGGDAISITWMVLNDGQGASALGASWRDRAYISSDSVLDLQSATYLGQKIIALDLPLAPDSSYTRTLDATVPYSFSGTHYIHVLTDAQGQVYESSFEQNNTGTAAAPLVVTLSPPPDLQVTALDVPASAVSGEALSVGWTIGNLGLSAPPTGVWQDKIYMSELANFDADSAIFLGTYTNYFGTGLSAGGSYDFGTSVTLPQGLSGDYYVYVQTDAGDAVFEYLFENNNTTRSATPVAIALAPYADLRIVAVAIAEDTLRADSSYLLSYTLVNMGTGAASGWRDELYLAPDSAGSQAQLLLSRTNNGSLASGDTLQRQQSVSLGVYAFEAGPVYLLGRADVDDDVYEYDFEENNDYASAAYVYWKPEGALPPAPQIDYADLVLSDFVASASGASGTAISASWTLSNDSSHATDASYWIEMLYLSADSLWDGADVSLGYQSRSGALAGGASYSRSGSYTLPNGVSGDYYLIVWADRSGQIGNEATRSNNMAVRPIQISLTPAPDLVPTALGLADTLYAGQGYTMPYAVANNGPGHLSATVVDRAFLANSPGLSGSALSIGANTAPQVAAPGAAYEDSIAIVVPAYALGYYYVVLRSDNNGSIYEGGLDNNNTLAQLVYVLPASSVAADLLLSQVVVPDSVRLGEAATFAYTIVNSGSVAVAGNSRNGAYFSENDSYEGGVDALLGSESQYLSLAPGDSTSLSISALVTDVNVGDYYGIVRANMTAGIAESEQGNNLAASAGTLHVGANSLELGVSEQSPLSLGAPLYYRIGVEAGKDLLVSLDSDQLQGLNELYVAYGRVPSPSDYDARHLDGAAVDQSLLLPNTQAGDYYLLVQTQSNFASTQQVAILAQALPFSILSLSPSALGQGEVTCTMNGAGFQPGMVVSLQAGDSTVATASVVEHGSSMSARLTWDLSAVAEGSYTLVVSNPDGASASLAGIGVEAATLPLEIGITALSPDVIRAGKRAYISFIFENTSNVDVPLAKLEIAFDSYADLVGLETSGNVWRASDLVDTSLLDMEDWSEYDNYKSLVLTAHDLRPGQQVQADLVLENFESSTFAFHARTLPLSREDYIRSYARVAEWNRQHILNNADSMPAELLAFALEETALRDSVLAYLAGMGLFSMADVAATDFSTNCSECGPAATFSPGFSPGRSVYASVDFEGGDRYLWEINDPEGEAGEAWDLLHIAGTATLSATAADPMVIDVRSLNSYDNGPDFLTGWSPGYDQQWPIAIAEGGFVGFDAAAFALDVSDFETHNETHGGTFSLGLGGTDTLYLYFTARVPDIGEAGFPGYPGHIGKPGGRGGPGGDGDGSTAPGAGGDGGQGGQGMPAEYAFDGAERPAGRGGDGGRGGNGGPCQAGAAGGDGGRGGVGGAGQSGGDGGDGGPGGHAGACTSSTDTYDGGPGGEPGDGGPGEQEPGQNGEEGEEGDDSDGNPPSDSPSGTEDASNPDVPSYGDDEWAEEWTPPQNDNGPNDQPPTPPSPAPPFGGGNGPGCQAPSNAAVDACNNAFRELGCITTAAGCGELLGKAILFGSVAGPGGSVVLATISTVGCGLGIYNCAFNDGSRQFDWLASAAGCAISAATGGVTSTVADCGGYMCKYLEVRSSCDPNEIVGPLGYGEAHWVAASDTLDYKVYFENDPDLASAPAQRVSIALDLDASLNPLSFRLGRFGFGPYTFEVPDNVASHTETLDLPDSLGIDVAFSAGIDIVENRLFWVFQAIDPSTGLPPYAPDAGFLPVNDTLTGDGEGFVEFRILPKSTVATGDSVALMASIVFDINDPILTNEAVNTIDADLPSSQMDSLPALSSSPTLALAWSADDAPGGSGFHSVDVYVSEDDGPYELLDSYLSDYSLAFEGRPGHGYRFFTLAHDNVLNTEAAPSEADASTFIRGADTIILSGLSPDPVCAGAVLDVLWESQAVDSIELAFSADGGNTYTAIDTVDAALGAYAWATPYGSAACSPCWLRLAEISSSPYAATPVAATFEYQPVLTGLLDTSICAGGSVHGFGTTGIFADTLSASTGCDSILSIHLQVYEASPRLYVDADATGSGTGGTWADAYTALQDALAHARTCADVAEIWVAAGTYRTDDGADATPGDRSLSFELPDGVALYGAFAGGETDLAARDLAGPRSVLSGDIGLSGLAADNAYHVLRIGEASAGSIVDGFDITGGQADGAGDAAKGGGLWLSAAGTALCAPTLRNCRFFQNQAHTGAAIYIGAEGRDAAPSLANLSFSNNVALSEAPVLAVHSADGGVATVEAWHLSAAANSGGTVAVHASGPSALDIRSSIFYHQDLGELALSGGATAALAYSIIEGAWPGVGNADVLPRFRHALADDLRLQPCSPGVDAGDPASPLASDAFGQARPYNGAPDQGAYEFDGDDYAPELLDVAASSLLANSEYTDAEGWTHYYYCSPDGQNDQLLLSLRKNGQDIGSVADSLEVRVATMPGYGSAQAYDLSAADYVQNAELSWFAMSRYWDVRRAAPFADSMALRFYFSPQDLADVQGSIEANGGLLLADTLLYFFKVTGAGISPLDTAVLALGGSYSEYAHGAAPSLSTWRSGYFDGKRYAEYHIGSFSGGGGGAAPVEGGTGSALPVEWLGFEGQRLSAGRVALRWETASEQQNAGFVVERLLAGGPRFEQVGFVEGQGDAQGLSSYRFEDPNAFGGISYYRLRQVDYDGKHAFSRTVAVAPWPSAAATWQAFPNPAQDVLYVQPAGVAAGSVLRLSLSDVLGRPLWQQAQQAAGPGLPLRCEGLAALPRGTFILQVHDAEGHLLASLPVLLR